MGAKRGTVPSAWVSLIRAYREELAAVAVRWRASNAGQWSEVPDGEVAAAEVMQAGEEDGDGYLDAHDLAGTMWERCWSFLESEAAEGGTTHLFFGLFVLGKDGRELDNTTQRGRLSLRTGVDDVKEEGSELGTDEKAARADLVVTLMKDRNKVMSMLLQVTGGVKELVVGMSEWQRSLLDRERAIASADYDIAARRMEAEEEIERYRQAGNLGQILLSTVGPDAAAWFKAKAAEAAANAAKGGEAGE